jgi:hypothetical protein
MRRGSRLLNLELRRVVATRLTSKADALARQRRHTRAWYERQRILAKAMERLLLDQGMSVDQYIREAQNAS